MGSRLIRVFCFVLNRNRSLNLALRHVRVGEEIGERLGLRLRIGSMELDPLAQALVTLGCPAEKSAEMAAQLDKRARQLAEEKKRTYDEALEHLLKLMAQGWAAKGKEV